MKLEIFEKSKNTEIALADVEKKLFNLKTLIYQPFSKKKLDVLNALSQKFLRSELAAEYPQIIVLGYWLRPASIKNFINEFEENLQKNCVPAPKGIAFHLPPENVDTMFIYSWAISYLMGNANLVRLPTKLNKLSEWIIGVVTETLDKYDELETNIFCKYSYESGFNNLFSENCDVRVVWGGDKKISKVSELKLKPSANSINFPDRQSLCLIDSKKYENSNEKVKSEVAEKLFNDIFWFDQMGCGSPKAVIFFGVLKNKDDLYKRLVNIVEKKNKIPETSVIISKFVNLNNIAGKGLSSNSRSIKNVLNISEGKINKQIFDYFHGGGSLFHFEIASLDEISPLLSDKTQTISIFGLNEKNEKKLIDLMIKHGGLRVVDIGDALSFDKIWDGVDLFSALSKLIKLK